MGTGLGGYNLAKEFRKLDTATPLIIITQDDGHFYSKPQLSTACSLNKTPAQLIITDAKVMQTQLNATILTQASVIAICTTTQTIQVESGNQRHEIEYKDLVLALGATPKPFAILENHQQHYRINNLIEYQQFITNLPNLESLTIIGSGLVGCEFAHDFVTKIKQLQVVTMAPYPLYNLVPAPVGQALQSALEKLGVTFYTNSYLESVHEQTPLKLTLNTAQSILTNGVLTAIGLNPNINLARQSGIHTQSGIVVDEFLKTSVNHIYALGDCAQINGICRQYVAPILQSARALAQTLIGKPTAVNFPVTPISLKVSSYPVIICPPIAQGSWQFEQHTDGIKALCYDNDEVLQGYALSGSQLEHRQSCLNALFKKCVDVAHSS